jgi:membrane protease subunit (stomatin/prohibitin family)
LDALKASLPAQPAAEIKTAPATRKSQGKICPHCGAEFPQKLKFCGECGKAMA